MDSQNNCPLGVIFSAWCHCTCCQIPVHTTRESCYASLVFTLLSRRNYLIVCINGQNFNWKVQMSVLYMFMYTYYCLQWRKTDDISNIGDRFRFLIRNAHVCSDNTSQATCMWLVLSCVYCLLAGQSYPRPQGDWLSMGRSYNWLITNDASLKAGMDPQTPKIRPPTKRIVKLNACILHNLHTSAADFTKISNILSLVSSITQQQQNQHQQQQQQQQKVNG